MRFCKKKRNTFELRKLRKYDETSFSKNNAFILLQTILNKTGCRKISRWQPSVLLFSASIFYLRKGKLFNIVFIFLFFSASFCQLRICSLFNMPVPFLILIFYLLEHTDWNVLVFQKKGYGKVANDHVLKLLHQKSFRQELIRGIRLKK